MNILGKSQVSAQQMATYLIHRNPDASPWALAYAHLYLEEGEAEGVRGDAAWIQSCKETGNFRFIGGTAVTFEQNNFCGLGVTKKGMKGHSFSSPRLGIRAQIQHLKGYATSAPLHHPCIDPRYHYIHPKGKAPRFEDLAGKWAVPGYDTTQASSLEEAMAKGIGYGFDIVAGVYAMKALPFSPSAALPNGWKVAIDAGHGSETAGKRTPDQYREHWMNTKIAFYLNQALERCGIQTVKIAWEDEDGSNDPDLALSLRQQQIRQSGCQLSVSCHANAHGNGTVYTSAQGIETYIHSETDKAGDSAALAEAVQAYLVQGTPQKNRGVKKAAFALCNCLSLGTKASILIEYGFMTNEYEARLLKSDTFCQECAEETAQGICAYLGITYTPPLLLPLSCHPIEKRR